MIKSISQKYQDGKEVTERERRMQALRNEMRDRSSILGPEIDAYIVTTFDEHQSHQEDGKESRLQYISGFSGPIADAAVSVHLKSHKYINGMCLAMPYIECYF